MLLNLAPSVFKIVLLLITLTCRVRVHGQSNLDKLEQSGNAWIFSIWHDNVTIAAWALRNRDTTVMISDSKDGEIIARCVSKFGNQSIRGSSSSGSSKATRGALKVLRKSKPIAITPDGPRGPKYKLQSGVLWLSALGKAPIVPFHVEATRQWVFNSWDHHKLPKPFSTIHICFGEPYQTDRANLDTKLDKLVAELEAKMMVNANHAKQLASGNR